jgi:uncharacterized linocin/CFP29 family protein
MPDFILNGVGHGDIANVLLQHDFDIGALRPWIGTDGRTRVTLNMKGKRQTMVTNAPATLRKNEWIELDAAVLRAVYTTPARMFPDLRARGLTINIPNGMGKTVFEYEKMSDIGPATTSMDGIRESDADRPLFDLGGLPLPIVHKDFQYTARQLAVSRNSNTPLDTSTAELAARKVMEEVEKYTAGSQTYNYGGYNVYGYTNFPQRLTQTLTAPSSSNHATTIGEVLSMKKKLTDSGYYGPFKLYVSNAWDLYLDEDYSASTAKTNTLRERLLQISGIDSVETSYYLSGNAMVMVQMTPDVVQATIGMDVVTLQWPTKGGMLLNFKVMCILVPRLRADYNGRTGICHGS